MKSLKKIFIAICAFFVCGTVIFAYGGNAEESQTTVTGYIKYYGNVPFEFPGFETVDGAVYTLRVAEDAKFTLKDVVQAQGYLIELTGTVDSSQKNGLNVLKDGIFVVSEWKQKK